MSDIRQGVERAFDLDQWYESSRSFFPDRDAAEVATIVEGWREQAAAATGVPDLVLAAAMQRHLTARGTGLPSSFALLLTPGEAIAVKFNPRNAMHPIEAAAQQFGKRVGGWPRDAVRAGAIEEGRMADGFELTVADGEPIPCRVPRLRGNPAAAALLSALGADLPEA